MQKIRKFSPLLRAMAVIGAAAGLVTAVTFAALQSNTVALSPNTLTVATASLAIGAGTSCPEGDTGITPGLNNSALAPGQSTSVNFCLHNKTNVPLTITASIPENLSSSVAAQNTTLTVNCPNEGTLSAPLSSWGPGTFGTALGANAIDNCTATATLQNTYTGSGGETIPAFSINFIGNQ